MESTLEITEGTYFIPDIYPTFGEDCRPVDGRNLVPVSSDFVPAVLLSLQPSRLSATPWTTARRTPLSMGFSRHWKRALEWAAIAFSACCFNSV